MLKGEATIRRGTTNHTLNRFRYTLSTKKEKKKKKNFQDFIFSHIFKNNCRLPLSCSLHSRTYFISFVLVQQYGYSGDFGIFVILV